MGILGERVGGGKRGKEERRKDGVERMKGEGEGTAKNEKPRN